MSLNRVKMQRKIRRKNIAHISKRHLSRLIKEESEFMCKSAMKPVISSHINDKRMNNMEHASEINSDMIYMLDTDKITEEDNVCNESNENNDILMEYEYCNTNEYKNEQHINFSQHNATMSCTRLMRQIFTNELAMEYSWYGAKKKNIFENLQICKVIMCK